MNVGDCCGFPILQFATTDQKTFCSVRDAYCVELMKYLTVTESY